jgi:hypothetical protein
MNSTAPWTGEYEEWREKLPSREKRDWFEASQQEGGGLPYGDDIHLKLKTKKKDGAEKKPRAVQGLAD